ncbi:MAG: hypothetical protein RIA65_03005 [Woeseia sp.]
MKTWTKLAQTALLLTTFALGACASSGPYVAANNADDVGHYSTQLANNRYRVVYNSDSRSDLNRTKDYALLRAAELTLREGYTWFEVVDRSTVSEARTSHAPHSGVSYERAYRVERSCGLLACSESVRPTTTTGVHIDTRSERTTHSHALEVLMGNGEIPQKGGNYYNASDVAKTVWDRI